MNTLFMFLSILVSQQFTMERVVAVVGSEPVLHSEVITLMIESGIDEQSAATLDWNSPAYRASMEQVITEKLLVEAARREGVYPPEEEVEFAAQESMEEARSGFSSDTQFTDFLASMGMTPSSLRESYETILGDRIAGENFVRLRAGRIMSSLPLDPENYFRENPETVEEVLAPRVLSWIYIPVIAGDVTEQEALLTQVRQQIENGETTFSAAAALHSQDGSASSGGDLGWFTSGDMTATFEMQLKNLEPGDIAGPFSTPFGVHLIKVTDRDGEMTRASHILRLAAAEPADLDTALERAYQVIARVQAGEDFAAVAAEVSSDPGTVEKGGLLGTVNVGNWEGDLHDLVIALEPGDISQPIPVEQSMAVAVFKRMEQEAADWSEFSDDELTGMLQSVFWNGYYDSMVDSLRNSIPVLVNISDEN